MEIFIYDEQLNALGIIEEISSFIWTRRYWSVGEFKLLAPVTAQNAKLLAKNNLIVRGGYQNAAQILYVDVKKDAYGLEEMDVQGQFTARWLDRRVMIERLITDDTSANILRAIVSRNLTSPSDTGRRIPRLSLESPAPDLGGDVINYVSEPYISCLVAAETVAKAAKIGFEIQTNAAAKSHVFRVYKGRELTTGQTANKPCVFSEENDNVYEQEFTDSVENLRTAAYVGGEIATSGDSTAETRKIVEVGGGTGLVRREVFVNAGDVKRVNKVNDIDVQYSLTG